MVALFSTLLSASNEQSVTTSSSTIPTLVQLFRDSAIILDNNAKLAGHAVLAYQALEVAAPLAEGESTLFGHKRSSKSDVPQDPNLGVWNCRVSKAGDSALVDQLLKIPDTTPHYCLTVDLSDPSLVEPSLSLLQEALVRLLIQKPPPSDENDKFNTSLATLRTAQFGLAPEDKQPTKATDEADEKVKFSLMICAIVPAVRNTSNSNDAYKETQALNLVLYHLRKYAASLNATLCFVRQAELGPDETEDQPTMMVNEFAFTWLEWVLGKEVESPAMYSAGKHQEDLIESVLLRNASCPGHWEASKDSLWKALPPTIEVATEHIKREKPESVGDEVWLAKLRDSVETAPIPAASPSPAKAADAAKEDPGVSSFFENLLKK